MTTPTSRTKIIVSRMWAKPNIEAFVYSDQVGARMDLNDFITAVATEMGNPVIILTRSQLLDKLRSAVEVVSAEMKNATKHVV